MIEGRGGDGLQLRKPAPRGSREAELSRTASFVSNFSRLPWFPALMSTKTVSASFVTALVLSLAGQLSLRADDAPPARQRPAGGDAQGGRGFGFRAPGMDSLSQEEKDKLRAASEKAMQDGKVKAAREKMEAASKEFRDAMRAAQLAADSSVEPILKKLDEAREKAMQEGRGGRRGEAPAK